MTNYRAFTRLLTTAFQSLTLYPETCGQTVFKVYEAVNPVWAECFTSLWNLYSCKYAVYTDDSGGLWPGSESLPSPPDLPL